MVYGGNNIVYSMARRVRHDILYGLMGLMRIAWYMVWPYGHGMGHGMVLWYSLENMAFYMVIVGGHGIWYGLSGMTWYMVWPGEYGMVYRMA